MEGKPIFTSVMATGDIKAGPTSFSFPKLSAGNFQGWKRDVEMFLATQVLDGFLDGSEQQPFSTGKDDKAEELAKYRERKAKAYGYLYLTLDDENKLLVGRCKTAEEIWRELARIY